MAAKPILIPLRTPFAQYVVTLIRLTLTSLYFVMVATLPFINSVMESSKFPKMNGFVMLAGNLKNQAAVYVETTVEH